MEVGEAHTQGLNSPCRWSSVPLAPTVKHLLKTVETLLLLSVLQVGSAQEGKVLGVPRMLPPHLTIEAVAERKWFHSPSVRSIFYALCYLSVIHQLLLQLKVFKLT